VRVFGFGGCAPCTKYYHCATPLFGGPKASLFKDDYVKEAQGANGHHPFAVEAAVRREWHDAGYIELFEDSCRELGRGGAQQGNVAAAVNRHGLLGPENISTARDGGCCKSAKPEAGRTHRCAGWTGKLCTAYIAKLCPVACGRCIVCYSGTHTTALARQTQRRLISKP